ncbi:chromate resistance protein [Methylosoma difficile]
MNNWLLLILSLPTENTTVRMRVWRSIKTAGAAVLRDGVYILPNRPDCLNHFQQTADAVNAANGTVFLMPARFPDDDLCSLFDRSQEYLSLQSDIEKHHQALTAGTPPADLVKPIRKLQKSLTLLQTIDFFPSTAQSQTIAAMTELNTTLTTLLSPQEPSASQQPIIKHRAEDFQNRRWATRQHLWVDRLASAWLIKRHIDPAAQFVWLASIADCPSDAIGFDFDGAPFSHVGARVTFESMLASFDLETPALLRLAKLVHYLDVGGIRPAETTGIEQVLTGLKTTLSDDDQFLAAANCVFDGLYAAFLQSTQPHHENLL